MSTPTENAPKAPERRKKLGELLLPANLIDQLTLEKALEIQKTQKRKIGQILTGMGVMMKRSQRHWPASLKSPFYDSAMYKYRKTLSSG